MLLNDERSGLTTGGDREPDGAVGRFDLHHQRAKDVDAEACAGLPRRYSG